MHVRNSNYNITDRGEFLYLKRKRQLALIDNLHAPPGSCGCQSRQSGRIFHQHSPENHNVISRAVATIICLHKSPTTIKHGIYVKKQYQTQHSSCSRPASITRGIPPRLELQALSCAVVIHMHSTLWTVALAAISGSRRSSRN